jgi:hypothetical protein
MMAPCRNGAWRGISWDQLRIEKWESHDANVLFETPLSHAEQPMPSQRARHGLRESQLEKKKTARHFQGRQGTVCTNWLPLSTLITYLARYPSFEVVSVSLVNAYLTTTVAL